MVNAAKDISREFRSLPIDSNMWTRPSSRSESDYTPSPIQPADTGIPGLKEVQGGIDSVNIRIKSIDDKLVKLWKGQEEVKKAFHRPIITGWHFYVHL